MKGYRLHGERIASSGGSGSMRTIKYELADPKAKKEAKRGAMPRRDRITAAVFDDYRRLYGPLNFSDYATHRRGPSLLEFWLLTLKLGVFYGSSRDKLPSEFDGYRGRSGDWHAVFASIDQPLREVLNESAWRNFMIAGQRGLEAKRPEQREQVVLRLLRADRATDDAAVSRLRPLATRFSTEFVEATNKRAFKADLFGVELPEPDEERRLGLTWVINPEWAEIGWNPGDDPTGLIDTVMVRHAAVYGKEPKQWGVAMGIGNNGGYLNNILGSGSRQLLAEDGSAQLAAQMAAAFGFTGAERRIVEQRLGQLAAYLRALGAPHVVTAWSDYRSDFNGTVESWYSNRTSRHDLALKQLAALETALETFTMLLRGHAAPDETVLALAEELGHVVADAKDAHVVSAEDSHSLRVLQGELRLALNEWRNRMGIDDRRLAKNGEIGRVLGTNIQSSGLFFGISQRQRYEKLLHLKQDVGNQVALLTDIWLWALRNMGGTVAVSDRAVGSLATGCQHSKHPAVQDVYRQLEVGLDVSFGDQGEQRQFYISPYERRKGLTRLPFAKVLVSDLLRNVDMPELLAQLRADSTAPNLLGDVARLSATLLALALTDVDDSASYASEKWLGLTERQQRLLARSGPGEQITLATMRVLQSYIHAELSGAARRITRRSVVERATVQAVNGGQVQLAYESLKKSGSAFCRFYVNHAGCHDEPEPFGRPLLVAKQSYNFAAGDFGLTPEPVGTYLAVRSSKHQVQFLEWLLGKVPERKTLLRGGGAFTIAERTIRLDWSGTEPRVENVEDPRLFVSQPFTMVPPKEAAPLEPEQAPCFMGVDASEYGLAVEIVRCAGQHVEPVYSTFLADPQQRVLAARVTDRPDTGRVTLNSPVTYMARLVDSLTGAYRNRLHDLMLRYNAWPAFDWEVSDYGRGGRVAKVYSELKRSDVKARDNQAQNRQAWGQLKLDQHRWAKEATAAGTSQTCSRCKRWASLLITDNELYPLRPHTVEGLKVVRIGEAELVCLTGADQLKGTDLKRAVHAAMRPPLGGVALQLTDPQTVAQLDDVWKRRRGNMAVFVCPFTDCHHVADADLQAALNIALRGYAKLRSDGKLAKAIDLVSFTSGLDYEPVGLTTEPECDRQPVAARAHAKVVRPQRNPRQHGRRQHGESEERQHPASGQPAS